MKLLCAFRTSSSYEQLRESLPYSQLDWSDNLDSMSQLEPLLTAGGADLFVLDPRLWWSQEANELARRHGVQVLLFNGNLRDVCNLILVRIAPLLEGQGERPQAIPQQPMSSTPDAPVQIIEREKIVEKERIIEKEKIVEKKVAVPVHSYVSIPSQLCLVLNLTPRAGATFLSATLSAAIAARNLHVTLIEHPRNRAALYDQLNVSQLRTDYRPPLEVLEQNGLIKKESELFHKGISMYLNHPEIENRAVTFENIMRFIYQVRYAPIIFYDASFCDDEHMYELTSEFDQVFVVIDPDPVLIQRMMPPAAEIKPTREYQLLEHLVNLDRNNQCKLHLIVNRDNPGIDRRILEQCLPKKPLAYIPCYDPKVMYRAAWDAQLPFEPEMERDIMPVLREVLPEAFLFQFQEQAGETEGWIGKFFQKRKGK
jgi:hypothetical protein